MEQLYFLLDLFLTGYEQELFKAAVADKYRRTLPDGRFITKNWVHLVKQVHYRSGMGSLKAAKELCQALRTAALSLPTKCPVCGMPGSNEQGHICWNCYWERDVGQESDTLSELGPNHINLENARFSYRRRNYLP